MYRLPPMRSVRQVNRTIFSALQDEGYSAIFGTSGNNDCHVILRGGTQPNYNADSVQEASDLLTHTGLRPMVMIDMSHANSSKQHANQIPVGEDIARQIAGGEQRIAGVMIESHLVEGNQSLNANAPLVYGQSITDACVSIDQTEQIIKGLADAIDKRRV